MRKSVALLFLSLSFAGLELAVNAQEEYPVIVRAPSVSVTVFTNWQRIKLTYTVGYMDGYQVLLDGPQGVQPESMSFGLELDPEKGTKLEVTNRRKFKDENYFDLVYYLRYIDEKKGDLIIPEQAFRYVKEEPGKPLEGREVYTFKSPPTILRYDSVLTKGADDIIDTIDFGSFQKEERFWKNTVAIQIAFTLWLLFLLFRQPAKFRAVGLKSKDGKAVDESDDQAEQRLMPREALKLFMLKLQEKKGLNHAKLANGLKQLLIAYVPEILNSDTPKEIQAKILAMEYVREKTALYKLMNELVYLNSALYQQTSFPTSLIEEVQTLRNLSVELKASGSLWRRMIFRLKQVRLPSLWRKKR